MFEIYTSGFNLIKNKFDWEDSLRCFLDFADRVTIAVNTSDDETVKKVKQFHFIYNRLNVVETDFSYDDPLLDGKIKNAALQNCKYDSLIQMDLDERILLSQKEKWTMLANDLNNSDFGAFMIPSLDLWGDEFHIRYDNEKNVQLKWRLHKSGYFRGPVDFARLPDGHVDISKSDTTELIDNNGKLVRSLAIVNQGCYSSLNSYLHFLNDNIYTLHYGYVNFSTRILRNQQFWKHNWEIESGKSHDIPLSEMELFKNTYLHNLPLK